MFVWTSLSKSCVLFPIVTRCFLLLDLEPRSLQLCRWLFVLIKTYFYLWELNSIRYEKAHIWSKKSVLKYVGKGSIWRIICICRCATSFPSTSTQQIHSVQVIIHWSHCEFRLLFVKWDRTWIQKRTWTRSIIAPTWNSEDPNARHSRGRQDWEQKTSF